MIKTQAVVLLVIIATTSKITPAIGQDVEPKDRIITSRSNLAILSKKSQESGNLGLESQELRKILANANVHAIIIRSRKSQDREDGDLTYSILFQVRRRTKLQLLRIDKNDFDIMIEMAKELHKE